MAFRVKSVVNRRDLKEFIRLPYRLYKDDPVWVPPLLMEEKKKYAPKTNPMLVHCDCQLFLLYRDGEAVGRISAFVDRLALENWEDQIGLFGSYECIDDEEGSKRLLEAARAWLRDQGMTRMRGAWSFASQEFGVLVEGFNSPPMIMAPYNPPYYNELIESFEH